MFQESPQPNLLSDGIKPGISLRFWCLVVLTGIGAGIAAGLLMQLLRFVQHAVWSYSSGEFLDAVREATAEKRVVVLLAAGILVALVRWLMSLSGGGHGGEVAAAIWLRAGRLPPLTTAVKGVLSIVIVGMGASLGREAAPKQFGALIADLLCDWTSLPEGQRRLLVACGAGAGIGAVYNVPLGGALFALEVLLGSLSLPLVAPALATSCIATAVSWLLLPNQATYAGSFGSVAPGEFVWAVFAGPIAGLASAGYIRLISWADALKPTGWRQPIALILVFSALGGLAIPFPELLGNGKDVVQETFFGKIGPLLLLALFVLKPLATSACLGSGAPGGLFTPTLTLGALLGGLLGAGWERLWPAGTAGSYALIGASAVLAGAMQAPVSAMVLMVELTRRFDSMFLPTLIAVTGAVLVTRLIENRSIYSGRIHAGRSMATEADCEAVFAAARYPELLRLLLRHANRPEPLRVVDEAGEIVGEISPEAVLEPAPSAAPLQTATAADFVRR